MIVARPVELRLDVVHDFDRQQIGRRIGQCDAQYPAVERTRGVFRGVALQRNYIGHFRSPSCFVAKQHRIGS